MPNKYMTAFQKAKQKYQNQEARPGYPSGYLTWLRHTTKDNKSVSELESKLANASDEIAKDLIRARFTTHQFNNHSFNNYLLDELLAAFPDEDWQRFNPNPIVFYQGTLYRGTTISPNVIFKKGFDDLNPSNVLKNYISDLNGSVGVSTAKDHKVAKAYALPTATMRQLDDPSFYLQAEGYVYEINYRGHLGIDLEKTHLKRKNALAAQFSKEKSEVNVAGKIEACDVVRAWKFDRHESKPVKYDNLNYLPDDVRKIKESDKSSRIIVPSRDFFFTNKKSAIDQERKSPELSRHVKLV